MENDNWDFEAKYRKLAIEIRRVTAERDNLFRTNQLLRDRPDLEDRARKVDALIKENTELKEVLREITPHISMVGFVDRMQHFVELLRKIDRLIHVQAG
jgi:hypothetical protein